MSKLTDQRSGEPADASQTPASGSLRVHTQGGLAQQRMNEQTREWKHGFIFPRAPLS